MSFQLNHQLGTCGLNHIHMGPNSLIYILSLGMLIVFLVNPNYLESKYEISDLRFEKKEQKKIIHKMRDNSPTNT